MFALRVPVDWRWLSAGVLQLFVVSLVAAPLLCGVARGMDHVTFRHDDEQTTVTGKILIEAQDGGLLLLARDGTQWVVEPDKFISKRSDAEPLAPFSADELAEHLLEELPEGFQTHSTRHYLICFNTSRAYAAWCGALFERLYMAFTNFWQRKGIELEDPEFPLVAVVFHSKPSYLAAVRDELGDGAESIVGYYSLQSNRVMMYDLTGIE